MTEKKLHSVKALLRPYFTDVKGPTYAIVNLPEVTKTALFARMSNSSTPLRQIFLEEIVESLDTSQDKNLNASTDFLQSEGVYDAVFSGSGYEPYAQLGSLHIVCENVSMLLAKEIERGRRMSYAERSTRTISFDQRLPSGRFDFYRPQEIMSSRYGTRFVGDIDRIFDIYSTLVQQLTVFLDQPDFKSVDVKKTRLQAREVCDALRGLLPACTMTSVAIAGSPKDFERLMVRLKSSALKEANELAESLSCQLQKVVPSIFSSERSHTSEIAQYQQLNRIVMEETASLMLPHSSDRDKKNIALGQQVHLVDFDAQGQDDVIVAMLHETSAATFQSIADKVATMTQEEKYEIFQAYCGNRTEAYLQPGRAFEHCHYKFEIEGDYGCFRDIQRHHLMAINWQMLDSNLGYYKPELIEHAAMSSEYDAALERSTALVDALAEQFDAARSYGALLAHRVRYLIQVNAKEALQLCEQCSAPDANESMRELGRQIYGCIKDEAGHKAIADSMMFANRAENKRTTSL